MGAEGIVISPGPCDPDRAGICLDVVGLAAERRVPLLGVCLGHQCIGQRFNGVVERAPKPMHGKISTITHDGTGIFAGIESPFQATRYHSLAVRRDGFPNVLRITAESEDGVIQGLEHHALPIYGVQFHPESIASQHGHDILKNFIELSRTKEAA